MCYAPDPVECPILVLIAKKKPRDVPYMIGNQLKAKLEGYECIFLIKVECSNHSNHSISLQLQTNQLTKDRSPQFRGTPILSLFLCSMQPPGSPLALSPIYILPHCYSGSLLLHHCFRWTRPMSELASKRFFAFDSDLVSWWSLRVQTLGITKLFHKTRKGGVCPSSL